MALDIPPQGIRTYMDGTANALPANFLWRVKRFFEDGPGFWIFLALLVVALSGMFEIPVPRKVLVADVVILFVIVFAFTAGTLLGRPPAVWQRFPLLYCMAHHTKLYAEASLVVELKRRQDPLIEFEFAILAWQGEFYGAVLFEKHPGSETALKVFNSQSAPIQFSQKYVAPVSLQI